MKSMIESLIGGGIKRLDDKRAIPNRRPFPTRPRELFDLLGVLGSQANLPNLLRSTELNTANPRDVTFITLGRWPTPAELAALPTPYDPRPHLRSILFAPEFRIPLTRRICDAFPDKLRLLYVPIPGCGTHHFLDMANARHPIIPEDLASARKTDSKAEAGANFLATLGVLIARFGTCRTLMLTAPALNDFLTAPALPKAAPGHLPWALNPPPYRAGDRLFTILRDPTALALSRINGVLTTLRHAEMDETPQATAARATLGRLPPIHDDAGWVAAGHKLLAGLGPENPICTALGDGTKAGALGNCAVSNIELTDLTRYATWLRYTWETEPEPASRVSDQIVTMAELTPDLAAHLHMITAEDRAFFDLYARAITAADTPAIRGTALL